VFQISICHKIGEKFYITGCFDQNLELVGKKTETSFIENLASVFMEKAYLRLSLSF